MSTWPHAELPGAGPIDECELDAACWRKRSVHIEQTHADAMDECADWATRQRPACAGTCETADGCSCCGGKCPTPQACERPDPSPAAYVFPLEPILTRHQWLGPTLLALVCFVWLCIDGYMGNLP